VRSKHALTRLSLCAQNFAPKYRINRSARRTLARASDDERFLYALQLLDFCGKGRDARLALGNRLLAICSISAITDATSASGTR
jgi:hypothetical protein